MSLHSYDHPRKLSLRHINSPCQGCSDRKVGCHAECERYAAYKAEAAEIKKKKNEFGRLLDTLNEGEHRRMSTRRRKPE